MKKVVCARCGLVNLDKFVSFPHCAACGAVLPSEAPSKLRRVWRRPVKPLYGMLAVGSGLGMLSLTIVGIARETRGIGEKTLLVYAQVPRKMTPGQNSVAQFTLDSAQQNPDDVFETVSLRLSQRTLRDFVIVGVAPMPTSLEKRGNGVYYLWDELPRSAVLKLTIRPRIGQTQNDGVLQLHATLSAMRYRQFDVKTTIATEASAKSDANAAAVAPIQTAPKVGK